MSNMIENSKEKAALANILTAAMKTPGVKINRAKFLRKELLKYVSEEQIQTAIKENPAKAGISKETINKISKQVINYEATKVTGISVVASLPGGPAAVAAAFGDIASYFAFILRTVQELAYLYGFEQFNLNENDLDSESMQYVLIFMGVMFGVQGATSALGKVADHFAKHLSKKLAAKALTTTSYYPLIKKAASTIGLRMTKQIFADTVASAVPVVGGVLSGGLTYAAFKPYCMRLRKNLMSYNLCDPEFFRTVIDVDCDVMEK